MHVHMIGVAGTGMGALAGLLRSAGHRVTGSDTAFYPPMGDVLRGWGVETLQGFDPAHLIEKPDLVVVGNVCRRDNVEARAAIDGGMRYASMPGTIDEMFLQTRPSFVVAGTHGKTTTSTLLAYLLHKVGKDPGFLVGGVPKDFNESFRVGAKDAPFVIEGDEYDSAFFEKTPKFWRYRPFAALLTSIEHDHVDIYPTMDSYRAAFVEFVKLIPEDGLLVAYAGDVEVRKIAAEAKCRVRYYALDTDDTGGISPEWQAALAAPEAGMQPFDLFFGGSSSGRIFSPLSGAHNVRNALGAIGLASEGANVSVKALTTALLGFGGVKRRQELRGTADGVRVYDDFAHHPTAVRETIAGIRARHPEGKLIAVFEPRSATASRRTHQDEYPEAFRSADVTVLAPVGRSEIAEGERLSVQTIAAAIHTAGRAAYTPTSIDDVVRVVLENAGRGDTILVMSNGAFGGIHDTLLAKLASRHAAARGVVTT
ncbi:MAG: UDP-N-acetylmuramate:L-alanyl-gamma-D-glutamyl-meso-diaminopimelate ligase [Sandaracinaceae bacterium]|nr:UDP-N-acetylmuramate:L-alanyl-gamma-D-glutamyl-meso-diaminopimelate ligase [Sandaracinaceae bacterium]